MTKRITTMFLLLAFIAGMYAMSATAKGQITPTATMQPQPTATLAICTVTTGFETGAVNLRTCAGTACEVIRVLHDGEKLTVITADNWTNVITADGITGWLNSNYCKGQRP